MAILAKKWSKEDILLTYYKTKCEVSREVAPWIFLTSLYRIQNDRKSAIIYLDWPDIG